MVISVIHGIIYSEELSRWNIMKFDAVTIKNFRNFENITIDLTNKNVLFGMNDVGKTNFLYALRFLFDKDVRRQNFIDTDYVAATRAKTKLILVYVNGDWSAGQFAKNINNILGKSGLKMKDVATIVNCTECISD